MRRFPIFLNLICLLVLAASVAPAHAQGTTPRLLFETTLSDSRNDKFPSIAASGQTVHIGGGISKGTGKDNTDAVVWTFSEQATSIGAGTSLGGALGQPDYSTVAMGAASDGSVYAIWSSIDERSVFLRRRDTSGAWGPRRTVFSGGFPIFPQVAVGSNGQVFAVWQDIDQPVYLRVSNDQGVSWPGAFTTSEKAYSVPPSIATGPAGQVSIGFTTIGLSAAVAVWNGSGLGSELLTGSGTAADTTTSIGPDGKIYAAWRGIENSGANSGVHYAERQAANSWAQAQLVGGEVKGSVSVVVDPGGSVHLGWIANVSGALRFYYSLRQSGQSQFSTPVATNSIGLFNSRLAVSSNGAFAHASLENFSGSLPFITYARFSGGTGGSSVAATPQISGGETMIKRPSSVSVSFLNVTGDPTQIRWRWGSAPTDADNNSNGWQSYASPLTITVPSDVLDAATCSPLQLFTQVRNANQVTGVAQSDDVLVDAGVTAAVALTNPHMLSKAPQFSDLTADLGDFSADGGASDGHPGYTRDPLVYVGVEGIKECSGIEDLATGRSSTTVAPALTVSKDVFSNVLPLPGAFRAGSNPVLLVVSDKVGNTRNYTQTLIFDTSPPVLDAASSSFSATSNTDATILAGLKFANISVSDNVYPGRGFWGVWVANSRTAVANPASDPNLVWFPLEAPGTTATFNIPNWSLASGLKKSEIATGDYYIYVRFLDGAGNPTASVMPAVKLTLTELTYPKNYLPLIRR